MDRYDAWKFNPMLHQIQRAAGIDPDGPCLVPMRPASEWGQNAARCVEQCAGHYRKQDRDAQLCRAIMKL